eukprot:TRINITY_DN10411_c0_g1_i1.p1 TRINITY_DN10411_c0_g1~~TRINITY_DN10411_c0_g1_i1.p1  ORF type:complete len:314 (-),score=42.76 TRINITY_DN10411_c0_g1_i1:258-1151(-)
MKGTFAIQKQVLYKYQSKRFPNSRVCQRKIVKGVYENDDQSIETQYKQMLQDPEYLEAMRNPKKMQELYQQQMQDPESRDQLKAFEEQMKDPEFVAGMERKLVAMQNDPEIMETFKNLEMGGIEAVQKQWKQNPQKYRGIQQKLDQNLKINKQSRGMTGQVRKPPQAPPPEEFFEAVKRGNIDAVDDLLVRNANAMSKDESGRTPLHYAVFYNHPRIVALLLIAGASVDAVDNSNNTPVHYACAYARQIILSLLLEKEPDLSMRNEDSKTALDIITEDPRNPIGRDRILMQQMTGER